jgi:hypothetical protein
MRIIHDFHDIYSLDCLIPTTYLIYSTVVICHTATPMLPLGRPEYPDQHKGVYDGIADS